jgi:CRP/FNR family cyclic AMP-dependent transcriptional regulator
MISPELLRRYPFFSQLSSANLKAIAMISEEVETAAGATIFDEGNPAELFYFLIEGTIDLSYVVKESHLPRTRKEFEVGEIDPEEIFGISSLIEPYLNNATGKAAKDCRYITIDAKALRALMELDNQMGFIFMSQVAKVVMQQLIGVRVQLAAAWA